MAYNLDPAPGKKYGEKIPLGPCKNCGSMLYQVWSCRNLMMPESKDGWYPLDHTDLKDCIKALSDRFSIMQKEFTYLKAQQLR